MPEYTLITFFSLLAIGILDLFILKTKLLTQKKYYLFLVFVIVLQTIVDNYLNGRWWQNEPIIGPYGKNFYSNIVLWHTPLENYFYGIGLITLNLAIYEHLTKNKVAD